MQTLAAIQNNVAALSRAGINEKEPVGHAAWLALISGTGLIREPESRKSGEETVQDSSSTFQ